MTPSLIKTILLVVLAGGLTYSIISGRSSIKEAHTLTTELNAQVDSLKMISEEYTILQGKYDSLLGDLSKTKENVTKLREKIDLISKSQTNSVLKIKNELQYIIGEYDSPNLVVSSDSTNINELRF